MKCSLQPAYTQAGNATLIIYTFLVISKGSLNLLYKETNFILWI